VTSVFEFARSHHCIGKVDDWRSLAVVDHGNNSPRPSLFIFTKDMSIMINQNLYTSLGDFVLDTSANVYSFGDNKVGEYFQTMVL